MSRDRGGAPAMSFRLQDLNLFEQVLLAVSLILLGVYVLDPFFLERSKALAPEARSFLRSITDIGRSNWMLVPAGSLVALALVLRRTHLGFRNAAGYGLIASTIGFVFVSVGGRRPHRQSHQVHSRAGAAEAVRDDRPPRFPAVCLRPRLRFISFRPRHQHLRACHRARHIVAEGQGAALHGRGLDRVEPGADRPALFHRRGWGGDSRDGVPVYRAGTIRLRGAGCSSQLPGGGYRLRGERTRNWLGWPKGSPPEKSDPDRGFSATEGQIRQG